MNIIKELECQYLQFWDDKSENDSKVNMLHIIKEIFIKEALSLLKIVSDIELRKKICKLTLGCSTLFSHKYLNKNKTPVHFVLTLGKFWIIFAVSVRNRYFKNLNHQ